MILRSLILLLGLALAVPVAADDCQSVGAITPLCGIQAPEDIELTPNGRYLLLSQFGGLPTAGPGGIALFDLKAETHEMLVPRPATGLSWGSDNCPAEPGEQLSTHGIHLSRRDDGRWQLLAVNHGGRESVEFFELRSTGGKPGLAWRGCVLMPGGAYLNDVVALPGGGLLATHMMDRHDEQSMADAMQGKISGHVFEWHPGQPVKVMAGSESPFPNGIQISADGRFIFLNVYIRGEVWKLDRNTGERVGTVKVVGPDNSLWRDDGKLLVASHTGMAGYDEKLCTSGKGFCPVGFQIVAIDPDSLSKELVFEHDGSAPMGAGTVALQLDQVLYIGSYAGDRLFKVELPEGQ